MIGKLRDPGTAGLVIGVIRPDCPRILATIQVADVEPSTARRRPVELAKQIADTGDESSNGVRNLHLHQSTQALSAVAGTGPPPRTDTHFWAAAPRMITASASITAVQIVRIHPSVCRAALAPVASG